MLDMGSSAVSTLDQLRALHEELRSALHELAGLTSVSTRRQSAQSGVIFVGNPHSWRPLSEDGRRAILRSAPLLEQWDELATNAILATMPTRRTSFDKAGLVSRYLVEQNGKGALPVRRLISALDKGLDDQLRLVEALPTAIGNNERLLVPDTNAILFRPDLEAWQLDGAWTIVIVPQVTRELDERKDHPKLGERARAFNGRLEDYERRGDTFVGVPLSGLLTVREVPIEADVSLAPKWLRAGHPDDRILASALELSWRDLTATVAIATRDRAMRNKARFSRLATVNVETL